MTRENGAKVQDIVNDRLLRAIDVADLLGISANTVLDWGQSGKLPSFKLGGKNGAVRFRESDVLAWLETQRRQAVA